MASSEKLKVVVELENDLLDNESDSSHTDDEHSSSSRQEDVYCETSSSKCEDAKDVTSDDPEPITIHRPFSGPVCSRTKIKCMCGTACDSYSRNKYTKCSVGAYTKCRTAIVDSAGAGVYIVKLVIGHSGGFGVKFSLKLSHWKSTVL